MVASLVPAVRAAGFSAAQALPAIAGALLGIPGGLALFGLVSPDDAPMPPLWSLITVVPATALAVFLLTAVPARLAARHPVAEALHP